MTANEHDGVLELILVRHAKSDWGYPGLLDHDRPLNDRGLRDAPAMARRLAESGVRPDRILSSTALRARTTAAEFGAAADVKVDLDQQMYASSAATLASKAGASGASSVMLVAHNPGITDLAFQASGGEITHMPTCAVARFTWKANDWSEVDWSRADTWSLATPR